MPDTIYNRAAAIRPLNSQAMMRAEFRLDDLTKPKGSLGILEKIVIQLAGITGNIIPSIDNAGCVIFAADHGVS